MSRQTVPAHNEDSRYYAPVFYALLFVIGLLLGANPFGWGEAEPSSKTVPKAARCEEAPERYGGRLFCSVEGGQHGYVNPGSMEWEVE